MKNMHNIWYHGSDTRIEFFNPYAFDLGNTFQKPGWSTFCFIDYEYTKKFTIMRCIQHYYDMVKNGANKSFLHNNRCTWDFINEKPITTKDGLEYIIKSLSGTKIYIHWIDSSRLKKKSIGNDVTHDEFTFRDSGVLPIKIETITLTSEELEKNLMVVNDVNLYRNKLVEFSEFYNRGLLSLFIKYDYTLNRDEIEKIIIAIDEGRLKIGDDLKRFIVENNIKIKRIPLYKRLKKSILGAINKKFFRKKYKRELEKFDSEFEKNLNRDEPKKNDEKKENIVMENDKKIQMIRVFNTIKKQNPNMSLDELLFAVYERVKSDDELFEAIRPEILKANGIDELEYYTQDVDEELKKYIEENVFPKYDLNDKGHGIIHILEVIRRSFALNETLRLGLDKNMIYAIAACHDLGKYINSDIHEKIAADMFIKDENMKRFFTDDQRVAIKEAIEDHRSSKKDNPRTKYGELISSADRNTRIEIVFIRSFFVAHERMPDMNIEDYLDFTFKRLSKRYGEENPENMFLEDETYRVFLKDMRELLKHEEEFKNRYCEVNHITSRTHKVSEEQGEVNYTIGRHDVSFEENR